MLVDQRAFVAGQRDVRAPLVRVGRSGGGRLQEFDQSCGLGRAQQSHGVGAAAGAVQHLRQKLRRAPAKPGQFGMIDLSDRFERRAGDRVERNRVHDVRAQRGHFAGHLGGVLVVDAGHDDGVDLDRDAVTLEFDNGETLPFEQRDGAVHTAQDPDAGTDPGVNLRANRGIHRIHGESDVAHLEFCELGGVGGYFQPVAGYAQQHLRVATPHQAKRLQRRFRTSERIARSGDSHHADLRRDFERAIQVVDRLLRREDGAGNSGPAFVEAMVLPVAEVTLHVAPRRHRKVNPRGGLSRRLVEARVLCKIQSHRASIIDSCNPPVSVPGRARARYS